MYAGPVSIAFRVFEMIRIRRSITNFKSNFEVAAINVNSAANQNCTHALNFEVGQFDNLTCCEPAWSTRVGLTGNDSTVSASHDLADRGRPFDQQHIMGAAPLG